MGNNYLVEMENICKSFYGVQVLKDVTLRVKPGEVMALVGENGAGKSTLMNILCGLLQPDSGSIKLHGAPVKIQNPSDAYKQHIAMVHQEICLVEQMSIEDNVFLGSEPRKDFISRDKDEVRKRTQEALDMLGMGLTSDTIVGTLNVAQQQLVEVARAVCFNANVVIFDEPTASLTDKEIEKQFETIRGMQAKGIAIIYISHRMDEIFQLCNRVTVLRDSQFIATKEIGDTNYDEIVSMMVGREISELYGHERNFGKEPILEVKHLTNKRVKDVSFTLKRGEILGFAGLVGAGRTEMSRALFGVDPIDSGEVYFEGKKLQIKDPGTSIRNGFALVSEDRKKYGLILNNSVAFNLTLMVARSFIRSFRVNHKKETSIINEYVNKLRIKLASPDQLCLNLSGGNQQKVVISKCLAAGSKVLILDEPTRGIDIGAKQEIYRLIQDLVKEGLSIIMISSELPEILNLSSRIAVMHEGSLVKTFDLEQEPNVTQEMIMHYAVSGGK